MRIRVTESEFVSHLEQRERSGEADRARARICRRWGWVAEADKYEAAAKAERRSTARRKRTIR